MEFAVARAVSETPVIPESLQQRLKLVKVLQPENIGLLQRSRRGLL